MSDFIGALGSAAQSVTGIGNTANPDAWVQSLRKASFRGVPFYVDDAGGQGGRRLVTHEFPLRNTPYSEDLGRAARHYHIRAYCIGGAYMTARDKLITACETGTVGTLIHPYLGEKLVMAGPLRWSEGKDRGGYVSFDLEFVEQGTQPPPGKNSSSSLLAAIASALTLIKQVYAIGSLIASNPSILLGLGENILGDAVTSFFNLPAGTISGIENFLGSLASGTSDSSASGTSAAFTAAAANVLAAVPVTDSTDDPVLGTVPSLVTSADLTGGLAAMCTWLPSAVTIAPPLAPYYQGLIYVGTTDTTQIPTGATLAQLQAAIVQQAVIDLVRASAVTAVASIYAQTDFPTANAATAARQQMQGFIDACVAAAANAGQDDLYRGWRALYALVMSDMIERAQNLPTLATYTTRAPLPSLALSQLLYQVGTRGDELDQLNDVPHPLFMPVTGMALSQ